MWPAPPIREDVVSVIINAHHLHCGWLQHDEKKGLYLSAFDSYAHEHATHLSIHRHLEQFINTYQLTNSFLTIALSSPLIYQEFVCLSKASPLLADFQMKQLHPLLWDYQYLHALDDGNHLFYLKGIKKSAFFEYHLLAHICQLKLITLTSTYAAQLAAYAQLHGKAFRQSKLSLDLAKHTYNIAACFDRDALARMLHITAQARTAINFQEVLTAMIGSYYTEPRSS